MIKNRTIFAEMINKKTAATAIVLLASFLALPVYAAGAGRREALKSEGIIEYTDGEHKVLIDSGDLYYLADEIDNLETNAKWGTLQAIQSLPDAAAATGLAGKTIADIPNITFADLNRAIKSSQQSASAPAAAEILSGKVTWANGRKITGSMRNNGATGASNLNAGRSYSIPAGYTTGGTVTTASLASQTAATATSANISSGKTAWVNGQLVTGNGGDNNSFYEQGRTAGYEQGRDEGYDQGHDEGYDQGYAAGSNANAGLTGNYKDVEYKNVEDRTDTDNHVYDIIFTYETGITGKVLGKSIVIAPWRNEHHLDTGGGTGSVQKIEYDPNTGVCTLTSFGIFYSAIRVFY